MDDYYNDELREKPNHAHYPICRGRMGDIKSHGQAIFIFTLIASLIMSFLSFLRVPMHVIGWIPMIFNSEEISKGAFNVSMGFGLSQVLCCVTMAVFSALNWGKHKVFGIVLFIIYLVLLISSLLISLTGLDVLTCIIGILGLYYCRGVLRDKRDYEQLAQTEGFPLFSVVLAENDDKYGYSSYIKTKHGLDYYNKRTQQNSAPAAHAPVQPQINPKPENVLGDMPELNISALSRSGAANGKFSPKSGKEGTISFSPLKLR